MTAKRISRRKALALGVATVVLVGAGVSVSSLRGPQPVMRVGDEEAAGFADGQLLDTLIAAADAGEDRVSAVRDVLRHPTGTLADPYPFAIYLADADHDVFSVVTYYHFHNTSFSESFLGGPYWGRACRTYRVAPATVTVEDAQCAPSIPEFPR